MSPFEERVELLYRPFAQSPYSHCSRFYKVCWHLALVDKLQIETGATHLNLPEGRLEIFTLVLYIVWRLQKRRGPRACPEEEVYQRYRLFCLQL